jgi:hypothetical protein
MILKGFNNMKMFKVMFLAIATLSASFVNAATSRFEVSLPSTTTAYQFPGLDLNSIQTILLTTSSSAASPDYTIDRMELRFPNANNLVTTNFKAGQGNNSFYATVNNGWVFRKLIVELHVASARPVAGELIDVSVYVADMDYFNNNFATPPQGELLVSASGALVDVTPNPVADTHWMKVNNEGLSMKLYQRPVNDFMPPSPGNGFKLYMNWMGHGERTVYLPTPFMTPEYDRFKAVALNILTIPGPDGDIYTVEVEFEDEGGYRQTTPVGDLQAILDQAYLP